MLSRVIDAKFYKTNLLQKAAPTSTIKRIVMNKNTPKTVDRFDVSRKESVDLDFMTSKGGVIVCS